MKLRLLCLLAVLCLLVSCGEINDNVNSKASDSPSAPVNTQALVESTSSIPGVIPTVISNTPINTPINTPFNTPTVNPTPTPTQSIIIATEKTATPTPNINSSDKKETVTSVIEDSKELTVYITKTGAKYHSSGCSYLSKSCIPINLSDAKSNGYTPCSRCHPPR